MTRHQPPLRTPLVPNPAPSTTRPYSISKVTPPPPPPPPPPAAPPPPSEAAKAERAERLGKWAELVVANLYRLEDGMTSLSVDDYESGKKVTLKFNTGKYKSPREEAEAAFALARRLRRGSKAVAALIAESDERSRALIELRSELVKGVGADDEEGAAVSELAGTLARRLKKLGVEAEQEARPRGPKQGTEERKKGAGKGKGKGGRWWVGRFVGGGFWGVFWGAYIPTSTWHTHTPRTHHMRMYINTATPTARLVRAHFCVRSWIHDSRGA